MAKTAAARAGTADLSHNLLGQRLGRKGRGTRERILAATERLLADPDRKPISLSAVAREASLGMTTLYLYFSDLTELLVAVMGAIMESAEDLYVAPLRTRWPDDELAERCHAFVLAFHGFWQRNTRMFHLRNTIGATEPRMTKFRVDSARPVIRLMIFQMDGDESEFSTVRSGLASAAFTGMERLVTVATVDIASAAAVEGPPPDIYNLLRAQARLLELGIRDGRTAAPGERFDLPGTGRI